MAFSFSASIVREDAFYREELQSRSIMDASGKRGDNASGTLLADSVVVGNSGLMGWVQGFLTCGVASV